MLQETQEKAIAYYDEESVKYSIDLSSYSAKFKLEIIKKFLSTEFVVAEIGCATGDYSLALVDFVGTVDAFDSSKLMIQIASEKKEKLELKMFHFM